jgi:para-nitrobenzyl esterase
MSAQMVTYWSSFAHTGRPAARGLPDWLPFKAHHTAMRLKPGELGMFDASAAHQCPMWERLFPDELSR